MAQSVEALLAERVMVPRRVPTVLATNLAQDAPKSYGRAHLWRHDIAAARRVAGALVNIDSFSADVALHRFLETSS
jgi:hypothetical protein